MAGFGNGSVTMENDLNADTTVRTVVYPKLTHHIKSLLHISYDVPRTMSGLHRKKEPILRFLVDIEGVEEENLYGYRIEMQFFGKVTLSDLLQNPPITSAALPENVLCPYIVEKDVYINVIFHHYAHVYRKGLFPAMQHHHPPSPSSDSWCNCLTLLVSGFGNFPATSDVWIPVIFHYL